MDIKSFHASETTSQPIFDTFTTQGVYFTAVGDGEVRQTDARLTHYSRSLFLTLMKRCESSASWAKECAFVQISSKDTARQKVRDGLLDAALGSAVFFVCRTADLIPLVVATLCPHAANSATRH